MGHFHRWPSTADARPEVRKVFQTVKVKKALRPTFRFISNCSLYKVEIWLLTLSNEWRNERETCKLRRHVKTTKKLANFQSVDLFTRTLYSVQTNSFEREILIVKINRNISQFLPSLCHHKRKPFWKKKTELRTTVNRTSRLLSDAMIIVPGPVADRRLPSQAC